MSGRECMKCGRPMHRYGYPGDGLARGGRSHKPNPTACVNGLLDELATVTGNLKQAEADRDHIDAELATVKDDLSEVPDLTDRERSLTFSGAILAMREARLTALAWKDEAEFYKQDRDRFKDQLRVLTDALRSLHAAQPVTIPAWNNEFIPAEWVFAITSAALAEAGAA